MLPSDTFEFKLLDKAVPLIRIYPHRTVLLFLEEEKRGGIDKFFARLTFVSFHSLIAARSVAETSHFLILFATEIKRAICGIWMYQN